MLSFVSFSVGSHSYVGRWVIDGSITLFSGDLRLVPELGRVLDKLDIHLDVWTTIWEKTKSGNMDGEKVVNSLMVEKTVSPSPQPHRIWTWEVLGSSVFLTDLECFHH